MSNDQKIYPHVEPEIENWPIYKLHQDRDNFIEEIDENTLERLTAKPRNDIEDLIAKTIYQELTRIKEEPWKVDPPDDKSFWKKIKSKLVKYSLDKPAEEAKQNNNAILAQIINHYSEEIVGTFKVSTFKFARRFLTLFFNRLLNTAASRNHKRIYSSRHRLFDRLSINGEVDKVRSLMKEGTVVVVPTHFSNLDSILIGYVLDTIAGIPFSSFGAGLNLYNTGYTAYYMNRLGAYRVDRRKKNGVYLETLKTMSRLSIQRKTNSLFFPGGTRSRSGELETRLKLGLLGTAVEAQRNNYQEGKDEKVFIVPLILGYDMVLEADFLIEQHLQKTGKEFYLKVKDKTYSRWKILSFLWKLFSKSSDICLTFGKPMDVLGNFVDEKGRSFDKNGAELSVADYFISDGIVKSDLQREGEYTKILADRIVERYYKDNLVLPGHLMSFVSFIILQCQNPKLDLYALLRLPVEVYSCPKDLLVKITGTLLSHLKELREQKEIQLSEYLLENSLEDIITHGVAKAGNYHALKPMKFNTKGALVSEDFKLLYYYHNRLQNYGFHKIIQVTFAEHATKEVADAEEV
ncbi:MAG: 1-acyl-sn-glycerol-3-phosphate acyltransferase [Saprospiraceae bacterium]